MDTNRVNNEMLVHVPMCTHKDAKKVLVIFGNDGMKNELAKYDVEVVYSDNFNSDDKFDIVIYNSDMVDDMIMANVMRSLENTCGIFASKIVSFDANSEVMKQSLGTISKNFWIAMPYKSDAGMMVLASKKYHPQADIILDRSDFIETSYYNTELHNASFVMPNYIQKPLTGIAKR